jgi:hypothetical protein
MLLLALELPPPCDHGEMDVPASTVEFSDLRPMALELGNRPTPELMRRIGILFLPGSIFLAIEAVEASDL